MQTHHKQKMTAKQSRFVDFYLQNLNSSDAARKAGYSDASYGRHLITLPHVKASIAKAQELRGLRVGISIDKVIDELQKLHKLAMDKEDFSTATRILELLGRHVGAFEKDNKQRGRSVKVIMNFSAPGPVKEAVIIEDIDNCTPSLT